MKVVNGAFFLFILIPLYTMEDEADFFRITPHDFDQIEDANALRPIPVGFDPNAIEINYSTYIDGDLSVAGSYFPAPSIGNSKERSYSFSAPAFCARLTTLPTGIFPSTFGTNKQVISSWSIPVSTTTQPYISVNFGIPTAFDATVNPTIDLYIAVSIQGQAAGRTANFEIDCLYANSGDIVGINSPGTSFDQTVTTGNLSVTEPTGTNNLRFYKISVTLNGALITPGCFCCLNFSRTAPTSGTEYADALFIAAVDFNFSVT